MTSFSRRHRHPVQISDRLALILTRTLKFLMNIFYGKKYAKRAVILETVAAVPGMVAGMFNHMKALRRMRDDEGWIRELLEEAENERMHLMIFLELAKLNWFERMLVLVVQGIFIPVYATIYLLSSKLAHRMVGYFEEEACTSYTQYLAEIDAGRVENVEAPEIAIDYYDLAPTARLRDVIERIRLDEAGHRDRNHEFADAYLRQELPEHQS